jgi:ligand-binding sensor domain-containing protein
VSHRNRDRGPGDRLRKKAAAWLALCLIGMPGAGWPAASGARGVSAPAPVEASIGSSLRLADPVFQQHGSGQGFPAGPVTAIAQDGDGFLWIGTRDGLLRWDGYRVRRYGADPKAPGRLRDGFIQTLHADALGRLWIGTRSAGMASYDRDSDSFIDYAVGPKGLGDASVNAIVDDGARGVWVATSGGLDQLKADGSFAHLRHDAAYPATLPDNRVAALLLDRQGGLWIGTRDGLVRRDPGSDALQRVALPAVGDKQPQVESLMQDAGGKVWIGSETGAFVYDPFTGLAKALHDASGESPLETEDVKQVVEARNGEIWLGTSGEGIVVVDAATLRTHRIRHDPLVPATLANDAVRALYRDRSGLMWVGTDGGLAHAEPAQRAALAVPGADGRPHEASESAAPVVTEARIGGKAVPVARFNDDGTKEPLVVPADANSLSVEFSALDFSTPERDRYAYRLEGHDPQWIATDATRRVASYTNLPPGEFVLRVRASNRNGEWAARQLAVPIRVMPLWYQTNALRILLGLVVVGVGYAIVRVRTAPARPLRPS